MAERLRRLVDAYQHWLSDKESRTLVAMEGRRTEMLIGELMGPGERGNPQLKPNSPASEISIPREDRHRFRLLAQRLVSEMPEST